MSRINQNRVCPIRFGLAVFLVFLTGCASGPLRVEPDASSNQPVLPLSLPITSLKDQFKSILHSERINKIRLIATNFAMKAQMERNHLKEVLPSAEEVKNFAVDFNSCMLPHNDMVERQFKRINEHFNQSISMLEADLSTALKGKLDLNKPFDIPHLNPEQSSLHEAMIEDGNSGFNMFLSTIPEDAAESPALLVNDYLKAYFGSLESAVVNLNTSDASGWSKGIADALQRRADSPTVEAIADQLAGELGANPGLKQELKQFIVPIRMHEAGFVSRDGTLYGFPAISLKGDKVEIDESQVGADVLRINMEAIRDAFAPLPVVPQATVVRSRSTRHLDDITLFDPASTEWNVTAKDFMIIQGDANAVEAAVASAVGRVIRGGSWGSLNNEALAKAIETAAGVFARHALERSEWCVHKVKGKEMNEAMESMGMKP